MQLRHLKSYHLPSELQPDSRFPKVTALAPSPNNYRLACATADRYIALYDETGTQRDKFPTKPADKDRPNAKAYQVRSLAFSPDSTRLAVGQSDCIVFVYKLGGSWDDKKTICNKYVVTSAVTAVTWPASRANDIVFGCADGKVKLGNSANKSLSLYTTDSYVLSITCSVDGLSFLSAHFDGSLCRYSFPTAAGQPASHSLLTHTAFAPLAVAYTPTHILVAGNSPTVLVFDHTGQQTQRFDYARDDSIREFTTAATHPSGQSVVLGNFSQFLTFVYSHSTQRWEESSRTPVGNLYSLTATTWKADGSRLYTGSLCGALDAFDACLRRYILKGQYEVTYTAPNAALVRHLSTGDKMTVSSRQPTDLHSLSTHHGRYVMGRTKDSLVVADLLAGRQSEIGWSSAPAGSKEKERVFWDNEGVCLVHWQGELSVLEYGVDEVLACCRTEYAAARLISCRVQPARNTQEQPVRRLAYLLDSCTVRVLSMAERVKGVRGRGGGGGGGGAVDDTSVGHSVRIDWLELNQRGNKLLFRDKHRGLYLADLERNTKTTLLQHCTYVQWVPGSDVCVAQSRRQMYVWYSIDNVSDVSVVPLSGDVESIQRQTGKTEVVVDEGVRKTSVALDEPLIAFGSCIDRHDFLRAVSILEQFDNNESAASSSVGSMWGQLARLAMEEGSYAVAERCYAALGDLSRAQYLHQVNELVAINGGDTNHYQVTAAVAVLNAQYKRAESILLTHSGLDDAIAMYKSIHKWQDALQLAEQRHYEGLRDLRKQYYQYLADTKQEELAGAVKEAEGDYQAALALYLKGGFAVKAADLILAQGMHSDAALCDRVATALLSSRQFEKGGDFMFELGRHKQALDAYQKGHCYHRAVELARREFPSQVVALEEEWGDHLSGMGQYEAACAHYIQCGNGVKAMDSALDGKQFARAAGMFEQLSKQQQPPYALRLAVYYGQQQQYSDAERFYVLAGQPSEAVQMYTSAGLWDKAHALAMTYMSEHDVNALYTKEAQKLEAAGKWKDAEKLYVTVKDADSAIAMYRKHRQHDDMLRLIQQHRTTQQLVDAHHALALQMQQEGNQRQAEQHFVAAKDWKAAYSMYRDADSWEDALRVAKSFGGQAAYKQAAYEFAMSVGGEAGVKLLVKRGLGELAVDVAVERHEWQQAFTIAEKTCKEKLGDIHLQYAMALEDEGKFAKAEEEFIAAHKPKEAIDMYLHQQDWTAATRVSQAHDPTAMSDIIDAQAKAAIDKKEYKTAEQLLVQHKKAEAAVRMYSDARLWDDATRVAKVHVPRLTTSVQSERTAYTAQTANADTMDYSVSQAKLAVSKQQYSAAIDHYLHITADKCRDVQLLEQHYDTAVELAQQHCKQRLADVVREVCRRLLEQDRFETAAQVFVDVGQYQQAVDALLAGQLWDKAKAIAAAHAPHLTSIITKQQSAALLTSNNLNSLAEVSPLAAIDAYANSGEWGKVYELAAKQGQDVTDKYASLHAASLVKQSKPYSAVRVFLEHGCPILPANFPLYKRIATDILAAGGDMESATPNQRHTAADAYAPHTYSVLADLREMLAGLIKQLAIIDSTGTPATHELTRLLTVTHYAHLRFVTRREDLTSSWSKLSVALLRYTQVLPVDKAFYDAAVACRDTNTLNMAFVLFNRYIDLTDRMADPDGGDIDNADFLITDIPSPFDTPLPSVQWYSDAVREEAREWILEKAMSHDIGQSVTVRNCDKCGKGMYEAGLVCSHCQYAYEACVVSGYPVMRGKKVSCGGCQKSALREEWNKYVAKLKKCPWCSTNATPVY